MVKVRRKQKGAGGFFSKEPEPIHLDYSDRGLNNDELKFIISAYTPSEINRIIGLSVIGNNLTKLPDLPPNLQELYCYNNNLTSLPDLPATLNILSCANNQLTNLPVLSPNLQKLFCHNNNILFLPRLPPNLTSLFCNNNKLKVLPELPESIIPPSDQITTFFLCDNNPFIAPFDNFVNEYNNTHDISVLINNINTYYSTPANSTPANSNRAKKNAMITDLEYTPPSNKYPGGQGYHKTSANFENTINPKNTRKSKSRKSKSRKSKVRKSK